jgi:hypothetical protein
LSFAGRHGETDGLVTTILLVVALLLPTLVGAALLGAGRLWKWFAAREPGPVPLGPPIERIAADLRRLNVERHQQQRQGPTPGRGVRSRALTAAYLDVLDAACRVLEVAPPQIRAGRVAAGEIDRVESELRERGLDVEPHRAD